MIKDVPVGITIPYSRGKNGFFNQTFSDIERAKTNLKMLLLTAKGERPLMPTYGSDLRFLLFNPSEEIYTDLIKEAVIESSSRWMPEVSIIDIVVDNKNIEQTNSINLIIQFEIVNIPDSYEQLEITIEE